MVARALIQIKSPLVACHQILGLPALIRTLKALTQAGCNKLVLVGADDHIIPPLLKKYGFNKIVHLMTIVPKNLTDFLVLSGETHYDPEFIRWMVRGNVNFPDPYLKNVPASWWGPLDSSQAVGWARKKLFKNIYHHTEGWVDRYVNKAVSFRISKVLLKTSIHPNQITFCYLLLALFSCFLLMQTDYAWRVFGVFLMYFSSLLDLSNREVANLKLMTSSEDRPLQTLVNDVAKNLFFVGLFVGIYRATQLSIFLSVGAFSLLLSLFVSVMLYYHKKSHKAHWIERIQPAFKKDFLILVIFIFIIADLQITLFWIAVTFIAIAFVVHFASLCLLIARKFKKGLRV